MKKPLTIVLIILAVAFLAIAVYYWATPADSLPHFVPGYEAGVKQVHFKHGLAALILAVASGVWAWFSTGKMPTSPESTPKS